MVYERLANWMNEKRISIPQLAEQIGMTSGRLYASLQNETLTTSNIKKIAEVLGINPILLFEEEGMSSKFYSLQQENERLKDQILKLSLENSDLRMIKSLAIEILGDKLSESNKG